MERPPKISKRRFAREQFSSVMAHALVGARREEVEQALKEKRQEEMEEGLAQAWVNCPEDVKLHIMGILDQKAGNRS